MTEEVLKKAQNLKLDIWRCEDEMSKLATIVGDLDSFGSNISFKRNSDGFSASFGSKKHNFKQKLEELLEVLYEENQSKLKKYRKELEEL